jgi:hypothetical protein
MRYYLYAAVVGAILFLALQKFSREGAIDKYGTTIEQALTIERVRADLVEIASAEKENITIHMQCFDLDDLIESKALLRDLRQRQGFTYDIRCTDLDFVVTATPPREAYGAKIHNPVITVNQELEVREER